MAAALRRDVRCTYVDVVRGRAAAYEHRILANAFVDLIWTPGGDLFLTGPDTVPRSLMLTPGTAFHGVRFRPGHASAALGVPVAELADWRGSLAEVWGPEAERLADRINEAPSAQSGFRLLVGALAGRAAAAKASAPDPTVAAAIGWLERSRRPTVAGLSEALGVCERQFNRRFTARVGVGPKAFQRIARFRRFLALSGCQPQDDWALERLALDAGYADQSHLTREFRRLAGLPPRAHFKDRRSWA